MRKSVLTLLLLYYPGKSVLTLLFGTVLLLFGTVFLLFGAALILTIWGWARAGLGEVSPHL